MKERLLGGQRATLLAKSDGCSVMQFENHTGEGTMTCYEIFPGAILTFNDFHMEYFDSEYVPQDHIFAIDYCREGRMEYVAAKDAYAYVQAKDVKFDRRLHHVGRFVFPAKHYHGLTVAFDVNIAAEALAIEVKDFPVDLTALQNKYCHSPYPKVIHKMEEMDHIFGELYQVPQKIRIPYFKIKILELLLYLEALELPEEENAQPYFYKTQVEKVKAVQQFLAEHYAENHTQEELAKQFDISLTTMKKCFKNIYGTSIGAWLGSYRMEQAAELLRIRQELSIAQIAGEVGYDSASKFALAFRKAMGMSPTEYRQERSIGGKIENE